MSESFDFKPIRARPPVRRATPPRMLRSGGTGATSLPKIAMLIVTAAWLPIAFFIGFAAYALRMAQGEPIGNSGMVLVRYTNGNLDTITHSELALSATQHFINGFILVTICYGLVMFILLVAWFATRPG